MLSKYGVLIVFAVLLLSACQSNLTPEEQEYYKELRAYWNHQAGHGANNR